MNEEEIKYCRKIVSKKEHFHQARTKELVDLIHEHRVLQKEPNAKMKQKGVTFAPLLLGSLQFGKLKRSHLPFIHKELELRNIVFNNRTGIWALLLLLK